MASGEAAFYGLNVAIGVRVIRPRSFLSRNVLDNGRLFFETEDDLVAPDGNGRTDVYEWDGNGPRLISAGTGGSESHFAHASSSGDDVFFLTYDQLVGWDIDDSLDLYDARVGGGLPEPPAAEVSCEGDACQPAPVRVKDVTPASANFAGPGTKKPHPRRPCAKGERGARRAAKARCARHHRHAKHHKARERRASRAGRVGAVRTARTGAALVIALLVTALLASTAHGAFGLEEFDGVYADEAGASFVQAGGHPHLNDITVAFNRRLGADGSQVAEEAARRMVFELPAGLAGNPTVTRPAAARRSW